MERIPPPNTSSGAPDQMKTADHIFMKILLEMYNGIRKSPLQFESRPWSADPAKHQHCMPLPSFLVSILEMGLAMTVNFLNAASRR